MSGRSIHLIDRDELLATFERDVDVNVTGRRNAEEVKRVLQTIYDDIKESPVVQEISESCNNDSVIALHDIFLHVGSITYGKERWFDQGDGTWYDRRHCDYVPLDEAVERLIETVREIEEDMEQDRWIPVTEMLPDEHYISGDMVEFSDAVLATIVNHEDNENRFIDIIYTQEGRWKRCNADTDRTTIPDWCEVVAWMPLPEPYLLETARNYSKEGEEHETD